MKTFLSDIPQRVDFDALFAMDASINSAIRDVAGAHGMPASNGASAILEDLAAMKTAHLIHDTEDKDAFTKGLIQGLLIGAALPSICKDFVTSQTQPQQKGTAAP
uniref:Uncharacterized protein n=1 Tax=viral metagenome TaxID=1070528 RepID=A0A6M3L8I1_9ZZZZ